MREVELFSQLLGYLGPPCIGGLEHEHLGCPHGREIGGIEAKESLKIKIKNEYLDVVGVGVLVGGHLEGALAIKETHIIQAPIQ